MTYEETRLMQELLQRLENIEKKLDALTTAQATAHVFPPDKSLPSPDVCTLSLPTWPPSGTFVLVDAAEGRKVCDETDYVAYVTEKK